MNKKLYESLFFKLRSDIMAASSQLDGVLMDNTSMEKDTLREAYETVLLLGQLEAATKSLQENYQTPYEAPKEATRTQILKAWDIGRTELSQQLKRIEDLVDTLVYAARADHFGENNEE